MAQSEIKKAWERMKRGLAKEAGLSGGFYLNAKQEKNRTATYCVWSTAPYETRITNTLKSIEKVQTYDSWTDEAKENSKQRGLEFIERMKAKIEKYGTPLNQARMELEAIRNSAAFKKFQLVAGETSTHIEEANGCYYIRFNY